MNIRPFLGACCLAAVFATYSIRGQPVGFVDGLVSALKSWQTRPEWAPGLTRLLSQQPGLTPVEKARVAEWATLHFLIQSGGVSNGQAKGPWKIPYFWHYTQPNPRHSIRSGGKNLTQLPPGPGFEKYQSLADVDRTPDLFWADFAQSNPPYTWNGTAFYTFGWCSEREMAFKAWVHLRGGKAEIRFQGNHVWSEVEIRPGLILHADNTFGHLYFKTRHQPASGLPLEKWYNQKAVSKKVLLRVSALTLAESRFQMIKGD